MDSAQIMTENGMAGAEPIKERKRGISGSTIKIIAVLFMLIDHAAAVILTRQLVATGYLEAVESGMWEEIVTWLTNNKLLYYSYDFMRMAGRVAFPLFCFFIMEGFQKTRDVRKYLLRLGIFAIVSEIPFDLAISGEWFAWGHQNVFFTLFLGLFVLCCFEYFEKAEFNRVWTVVFRLGGGLILAAYLTICLGNIAGIRDFATLWQAGMVLAVFIALAEWAYGRSKGSRKTTILFADIAVLMLVMYLADLLYTDYSGMGVLTIVVMYIFRKRRILATAMGCLVLTIMSFSEITAFLAMIPIAMYNGERGRKMKYFFYAFYPVHLLLLYLVCVIMGMGAIVLPM